MKASRKTRIMMIDHMPLARKAVVDGLTGSDLVEIVAVALSPGTSIRKLETSQPDVILLDLEDAASEETRQLVQLVTEAQLPVVLLTTLPEPGRSALAAALSVEAEMIIEKPAVSLVSGIFDLVPMLEARLKKAHANDLMRWQARYGRRPLTPATSQPPQPKPVAPNRPARRVGPPTASPIAAARPIAFRSAPSRIIAVGASTGGTEVIAEMLASLPREMPGIVVVQHMPSGFTRKFAERLDHIAALDVKEAEDGDPVRPGLALIAPGGRQLRVMRQGDGFVVRVQEATRISGHAPSVNVLLLSVALAAGDRGIGVVLTGMGRDGAEGLLEMRRAGARTFAQDRASSVVYGMPAEADRIGAAEKVVSARDLPRQLELAAGT